MKRRQFMSGAAVAGVTTAAASALPRPAIAQGKIEWRMVTTWPRKYPGLGTGAELLADMITRGTDGRLTVKVFGANEVVPAFEAIDAVANGNVEMGHGAPYYWKDKLDAAAYIASIPFGMNASEQNAWFYYGGGQQLADKAYKALGCKFFPSGNTGVQMGGWFGKEMHTLEDFKGLKMRIPGLGGEVVKAAGGNVISLPGGEILPALESGAVDAVEWVGPYNDLAFGLHKAGKLYYFPGWHEPATVLDCFVGLKKWEALPNDIKAVIEAANAAVNEIVLAEFNARNGAALTTLVEQHKVVLKRFPNELMNGLGTLSGVVVNDLAAKDKLSREVLDSILTFRRDAMAWSSRSDLAYLTVRALPFKFPGPSRG